MIKKDRYLTLAKKIVRTSALAAGSLLILLTLLSLIYNSGLWILRILNFPRLQTLIGLFICLLIYLATQPKKEGWFYAFVFALLAGISIQGYLLFPYTPLAEKKIAQADHNQVSPASVFSILVANVYMHNRQVNSLLSLVREKDPTMVLTMEVNWWWVGALDVLSSAYPYRMVYPTANTYGMCLYSKLPLANKRIYFLNHDSVPSFHTVLTLPNGTSFQLLTLHPVAPKPSDHPDNMGEKEVALPKAARIIAGSPLPALVAGDFNDVGWSHNLSVFQKISGLHDVRYGRGLYNTFDATSFLMRWPLDYVFADERFKVIRLEKLPAFGSDHFPFYAQLSLEK